MHPPNIIPRPSPFFAGLQLLCIKLNTNRTTNNGEGLVNEPSQFGELPLLCLTGKFLTVEIEYCRSCEHLGPSYSWNA